MIYGSKRYKTSLIGSHIKNTHLDQTNGRVTTYPKSMQGIFWDKLQLQDQFTRIFLLETASRRIFYSTHDELCEHVLFMGHKELKTFFVSRHDSWFQPSHKVWPGIFVLGTAGSLPHPSWQSGNSLLVRGCVLGCPSCTQPQKWGTLLPPILKNHAVLISIRRGKVSPWWEKVFLPWN